MKKILCKIFNIPYWVKILLSVVSFAGVAIVLWQEVNNPIVYLFYCFATYCTCFIGYDVARLIRHINKKVKTIKADESNTGITKKYLTDLQFKVQVGICASIVVDLLYVAFKVISGVIEKSIWLLTIGIYHFILEIVRVILFVGIIKKTKNSEVDESKYYLLTTIILTVSLLPICGIMVLVLKSNSSFVYEGYLIYISAMYTFFTVIKTLIDVIKFKKLNSLLMSATKEVGLVASAVSVFALQTAMLTQFSSDDSLSYTLNIITSGFVVMFIVVVCVGMFVKSKRSCIKGE